MSSCGDLHEVPDLGQRRLIAKRVPDAYVKFALRRLAVPDADLVDGSVI